MSSFKAISPIQLVMEQKAEKYPTFWLTFGSPKQVENRMSRTTVQTERYMLYVLRIELTPKSTPSLTSRF
jgi:hypothetical protein